MFYDLSLKKVTEVYREDRLIVFIRSLFRYVYGMVSFYLNCKILKRSETTARIQGNRMRISLRDPGISRELIVRGIHEKISTREMQKRVKPGMHIIDIGANVGYYALIEAKESGKEGKVYAIEPIPANFKLLNYNIVLNNYGERIKPFQMAAGDEIGMTTIYLSAHSNRHSLIAHPDETHRATIQVPVTTIDYFIKTNAVDMQKLGLIRMDVEGGEAKILQGMLNTMKRCRKLAMFIEWHPNILNRMPCCSLRDCLLLLKSFGARFDLLLLADKRGKVLIKNKSIDEVVNSKRIMNNFMESWLTIENF